MTPPNEVRSKVHLARLFLREVWSAGDVALVDELLTDDYVHSDPLLPGSLEGPAAFTEWVQTVRAGTPDLTKMVHETYVDDDAVVATYTTRGTHEGDVLGVEATGRTFEVGGVCLFHVRDGRLDQCFDVWDTFGLFSQIGAFPEAI